MKMIIITLLHWWFKLGFKLERLSVVPPCGCARFDIKMEYNACTQLFVEVCYGHNENSMLRLRLETSCEVEVRHCHMESTPKVEMFMLA